MKTCIYLRKSRSDEESEKLGQFETLSRHRSTLLKVAKEQNLNIIEIKEELVSGESISYRPKMLELLDEVKSGLYDAVLVMDIDRLGRGNMQDQGLILETFKKSQTKIITPRKTYDLNNEWDEEYSEFEAFMARKELKLITRRMQRGRIKSVEEGKFIASKPPYGYKFVFDELGKKSMVIDEDKANIVKMIFNLYVNKHYGGNKIASHLNSLGLKTTTGRSWYDKGVRDILKNKTYAGYVIWNKVERGKSSSRTRPTDEIIESKGIHEAIIDESTWNTAQQLLKGNAIARNKSNTVLSNPLAGLIVCKNCGFKMLSRISNYGPDKQVRFIRCDNCKGNRSVKLDDLESQILSTLHESVSSYKIGVDKSSSNSESDNLTNYKKMLSSLEKEYRTLTSQKEKLHDLLEQGIYDVDMYLDRSKILSEKLEQNKASIDKIKEDILKEESINFSFEDIIPKIQNVLKLYPKTNIPSEKNSLLKSVIDHIDYFREPGKRLSKFNIKIYLKSDR